MHPPERPHQRPGPECLSFVDGKYLAITNVLLLFKPLCESPYPRGTPVSGLLRLGVHPGKTPAEPGKARKIRAELSKKYRKILPKSCPGASPEPPESVREPAGAYPSEQNAQKPKKMGQTLRPPWLWDRFWRHFGTWPGSPN